MSLNETPRGERIHISFFGRTNVGKSSIINAVAKQDVSIVSDVSGTTTDAVYKSMEIDDVGACVLIDTAGFDDISILADKRIEATNEILKKTDIAIMVFANEDVDYESIWIEKLNNKKIPIIALINKIDEKKYSENFINKLNNLNLKPIFISAKKSVGIEKVISEIKKLSKNIDESSICGHLVDEDDVVLLVMPQDIQAPKGRLILPQVQTIRDLLDNKCTVVCTTADKFENSLSKFKQVPKLIITDSQVFSKIYSQKPSDSILTSFSVLFSRYKGDIDEFLKGASAISKLKNGDKVLIAEGCTHNPLDGDIGRIKLPALLKKYTKSELDIEIVSGNKFPKDLNKYSIIIHCGSCMFNKKYVMSRINEAKSQNIPITNYGIAIAYMSDILDKIEK